MAEILSIGVICIILGLVFLAIALYYRSYTIAILGLLSGIAGFILVMYFIIHNYA